MAPRRALARRTQRLFGYWRSETRTIRQGRRIPDRPEGREAAGPVPGDSGDVPEPPPGQPRGRQHR